MQFQTRLWKKRNSRRSKKRSQLQRSKKRKSRKGLRYRAANPCQDNQVCIQNIRYPGFDRYVFTSVKTKENTIHHHVHSAEFPETIPILDVKKVSPDRLSLEYEGQGTLYIDYKVGEISTQYRCCSHLLYIVYRVCNLIGIDDNYNVVYSYVIRSPSNTQQKLDILEFFWREFLRKHVKEAVSSFLGEDVQIDNGFDDSLHTPTAHFRRDFS